MKKENGLSIPGVIIVMAIIILVSFFIIKSVIDTRTEERNKTLKSNMQIIQGTCKVLYQDTITKKEGAVLLGQKLSEADNYEINEFKKLGVISEEEYEKFYVLTDKELADLKLEITNEAGSYYLVNYETGNVIITEGINGKFTLFEFEKEEEEKKEKEENEIVEPNGENSAETTDENSEEQSEDKKDEE